MVRAFARTRCVPDSPGRRSERGGHVSAGARPIARAAVAVVAATVRG